MKKKEAQLKQEFKEQFGFTCDNEILFDAMFNFWIQKIHKRSAEIIEDIYVDDLLLDAQPPMDDETRLFKLRANLFKQLKLQLKARWLKL